MKTAFKNQQNKPRNALQTPAFGQPGSSIRNVSTSTIRPNPGDIGLDIPLRDHVQALKIRTFRLKQSRQQQRAAFDHNWGRCIVDQGLADDPGPINSGNFKPTKRWIVVYRTAEAGVDGTHTIITSDVRAAIAGQGTTVSAPFIIHRLDIWLAPTTVNTHFSGVIITKDDEANGILGGQYTDIAPYGEFVKFRVRYPGEGYVDGSTTAGTKEVIGLGGSAKWNGVVYALIETYD